MPHDFWVNLTETLFGAALVAGLAAAVLRLRGRRPIARRLAIATVACAVLGGVLEVWIRTR
jgi:hypothetical protein